MTVDMALESFKMLGAREAQDSGLGHIERQITAIEASVDSNPGLAIDLAKTLIESVCKSILVEHGLKDDRKLDTPKLLKRTLKLLNLVPADLPESARVTAGLQKTVNGLQTVIQGICEVRNTHGFASHGKPPEFRQLESLQAILVARASDAIVSFLVRVHRSAAEYAQTREPQYEDASEFNDFVDEVHDLVRIFDLEFRPSEVLFRVEPGAYKAGLADFSGVGPGGRS